MAVSRRASVIRRSHSSRSGARFWARCATNSRRSALVESEVDLLDFCCRSASPMTGPSSGKYRSAVAGVVATDLGVTAGKADQVGVLLGPRGRLSRRPLTNIPTSDQALQVQPCARLRSPNNNND